ncbi:MAG: CatB-related O-acetyltransferase [Fimbriimonas sp.]
MPWFRGEAPPNVQRFAAGDGECYLYGTVQAFGDVELGRFSYIGEHGLIDAHSPVRIGSFCSIASNFHCVTHDRPVEGRAGLYPFAEILGMPVEVPDRPIGIGHDVWIGDGVSVSGPTVVGDGCVIGAKAVLCGEYEPYGVYVGNPARLVRRRFPDPVIEGLLALRWWDWPLEKILANSRFFDTDLTRYDGPLEALIV